MDDDSKKFLPLHLKLTVENLTIDNNFFLAMPRLNAERGDFNRKFSNSRNRRRWLFQLVEIAPLSDIAA